MSERKKKTVILGAGESGAGAALLARQLDHEVFVSDRGNIMKHYQKELKENAIPYEEGQHTEARILAADEVVKSPGIPDTAPLVQRLRDRGIPVISEIEFAARHTDATLIGITGTNGKTTTTRLTHHLLHDGGLDAGMGGNVGTSFARLLTQPAHRYYVLELSSFQLDGIRDARFHIAMLLNITPDHLDRYEYRMENYVAAKFRIIRNQQAGDLFLYNRESEPVAAGVQERQPKARCLPLGSEGIEDDLLKVEGITFDMTKTVLRGRHNYLNALFAVRTALALGVDEDAVQRGLESFVPVPHRMEPVGEVEGVTYLNDSKATNVDAVYFALDAMDRPTVWILGGQDKGNDYGPLLAPARERVKAIVCLGLDNRKVRETFRGVVPEIRETQSAEAAVREAHAIARPGEVVLLSPACASFDLFRNYEDRGDQFRQAVAELKKEKETNAS